MRIKETIRRQNKMGKENMDWLILHSGCRNGACERCEKEAEKNGKN